MSFGIYKGKIQYWEWKGNINKNLLQDVLDAKNGIIKPKETPKKWYKNIWKWKS